MSNDTTPLINQAVEEIVNAFPDLDYAIALKISEQIKQFYPEK